MKTTPYYILFVKDDELGWSDEFGDYSRKEVMDNKDCYYMNKTKVFKIDGHVSRVASQPLSMNHAPRI